MNTVERLTPYYDFDDQVLDRVTEAAAKQSAEGVTFETLADTYGIQNGPDKFVPPGCRKPIEILKFVPDDDNYDESRVRIYHAPMGNPIDRNIAMRTMLLFAADPSEPMIVVGNPSSPGRDAGKMSIADSVRVLHSGSVRPAVEPLLRHLAKDKITRASQLGYSYGADRAVATATHAVDYGIRVPQAVFVEPASARRSNLLSLSRNMHRAYEHLQQYIDQSGSPAYQAVRGEDDAWSNIKYGMGLLRLSNLAIGTAIARGGFTDNVENALNVQPEMNICVGWGSDSELVRRSDMYGAIRTLRPLALDRVSCMEFSGMHHVGSDDIVLHAAMMLEGMRKTQ